jgi:hypothetical protein
MIDLLYGDHEGGQRVITRFSLMPRADDGWVSNSLHTCLSFVGLVQTIRESCLF